MASPRPYRIALALALAVMVAAPAVAGAAAPRAGRAANAKPVVISGFKNGPVDVPGSNALGAIASMKLPKGA